MGDIRINLIGKQFGSLKVVGVSGKTSRGQYIWDCECKCGKHKNIRGYHLTGNKIRSCGCLTRETANIRWPQHGEIGRWLWNRTRVRAKNQKIIFNLTVEQLWDLAQKQNKLCAISKQPLIFNLNVKGKHNASLDRIDSSKGYELGNVQWVTKEVNFAKHTMNQNEFILLCKQVAKNND